MDFEFSKEDKKLLAEVRAFIQEEATLELKKESAELGLIYGGQLGREFIRKFAAKGWLTLNWPEEYGGLGGSAILNFAVREEMAYAKVQLIFVAAHMAGPTIMHFGSEEMKQE